MISPPYPFSGKVVKIKHYWEKGNSKAKRAPRNMHGKSSSSDSRNTTGRRAKIALTKKSKVKEGADSGGSEGESSNGLVRNAKEVSGKPKQGKERRSADLEKRTALT